MIRRPPRSTRVRSSAASDVYKRQDRLYAPPEAYAYVPYGYEGPVVYGYTGYAPRYYGNGPRYYGYGPSYGPRYYGYGPRIYVDE